MTLTHEQFADAVIVYALCYAAENAVPNEANKMATAEALQVLLVHDADQRTEATEWKERVRLHTKDERITVDTLTGVLTRLRAEIEELKQTNDHWHLRVVALHTERDALTAKLQAMERNMDVLLQEADHVWAVTIPDYQQQLAASTATLAAVERERDAEHVSLLAQIKANVEMGSLLAAAQGRIKELEEHIPGKELIDILSGYCGESGVSEGAVDTLKRILLERDTLTTRLAQVEEAYNQLIMAVSNKWPSETRHQTALRYIQERENSPGCGPVEEQAHE